jgi:hypothetical protein
MRDEKKKSKLQDNPKESNAFPTFQHGNINYNLKSLILNTKI